MGDDQAVHTTQLVAREALGGGSEAAEEPRHWLVYRRSGGLGVTPALVEAATAEEAAAGFYGHAIVVSCEVFGRPI